MTADYRIDYDLQRKAIYARGHVTGDDVPSAFGTKRIHGLLGRPNLVVRAHRDRVVVELEYFVTSGHMEDYLPGGIVCEASFKQFSQLSAEDVKRLRATLGASAYAELEAVYRDPRLMGEGLGEDERMALWFQLFSPREDRKAYYPAPPEATTHYELGRTVSPDGKLPERVLRLSRERVEVALYSGQLDDERMRLFEELEAWPAQPWEDVEAAVFKGVSAHFGPSIARVTTWFYQRDRWPDTAGQSGAKAVD